MKQQNRIFTLEEVNALIPQVQELIKHILTKKELYDQRHDTVFLHELLREAERVGGVDDDGMMSLEDDCLSLEEDLLDLKREIEKVSELGCAALDLEGRCVDFLGRRNGTVILYCWKDGEDSIRYYRPYHSRLSERIPL